MFHTPLLLVQVLFVMSLHRWSARDAHDIRPPHIQHREGLTGDQGHTDITVILLRLRGSASASGAEPTGARDPAPPREGTRFGQGLDLECSL